MSMTEVWKSLLCGRMLVALWVRGSSCYVFLGFSCLGPGPRGFRKPEINISVSNRCMALSGGLTALLILPHFSLTNQESSTVVPIYSGGS